MIILGNPSEVEIVGYDPLRFPRRGPPGHAGFALGQTPLMAFSLVGAGISSVAEAGMGQQSCPPEKVRR